MENNKRSLVDRWLLYTVSLAVLAIISFLGWQTARAPQLAYVDIGKLIDQYDFRKELEKSSGGKLYEIKAVIDSLNVIKKAAGNSSLPNIDTQLQYASKAFNYYYEASNKDINEKIWTRLNPLLEQYGIEKNIGLIIGADGAGNVLYGKKEIDLTEDVIRYINEKYEKGS